MMCSICNRDLTRCICEDCDTRVESLLDCKFIDRRMVERVQAERFLARFEIEADREAAKQNTTPTS